MSELRAAIEADLTRVADRLRSAPLRRTEAAAPAARIALQRLADLAAGIDHRHEASAPEWRVVPELPVGALGDQLAVLGADLLVALGPAVDDATVWTPDGPIELGAALAPLADELAALRSSL